MVEVVFAGDREPDLDARIARRLQEQRALAAQMRALPGVTAVGMIDNIHLNLVNQQNTSVVVPGVPPPAGADAWGVDFATVDSGFFAAAGIPVLQGSDFDGTETRASPRVTVINEAMARRFWPNQPAVGQQFMRGDREYTVVGVAATAKIRTLGEAPRATMYTALAQSGGSSLWYLARTAGDEAATVEAMLGVLRGASDDLIPTSARAMRDHIGIMTLPLRLGVVAVASMALLAVALAAIGLYGSVSYAVVRRTREVGIRLALGAETGAVVRLLVSGGLRMVVLGVLVGLGLALLVARLMAGLLYGVSAVDPVTFVLVPLALLGVAAVASWLPARRVRQVSPSSALRGE
jgi:ABC-type antimicrobial peptide transport system permease subunit